MKIDARITILGSHNDGKVTIEIEDRTSSTTFATVTMTADQFVGAALGRLACSHCECEVIHAERIGKKMETGNLEFEIPDVGYDRDKKTDAASVVAKRECPAGWIPDLYFGSQGSFYRDGEKQMARCTIRRWVDVGETK